MKITDTDRINWLENEEAKVDNGSGKMWQSWEVIADWNGEMPDKSLREVIDAEILHLIVNSGEAHSRT